MSNELRVSVLKKRPLLGTCVAHHHILSRQCLSQVFACLLHMRRSLSVQTGPRLQSVSTCCIVWFGLPQGHSLVSASFHLWRVLAVFPTLARALFRATQSFLGMSVPLGSASFGGWMALLLQVSRWVHWSVLYFVARSGFRLSAVIKLLLDSKRLLGGIWSCRGCLLSFSCLYFWVLNWVSRLIWGGAIPASLWSAGRGVGLRVPVIMRQALFSSGSMLFAWQEFAHTGEQYSAVE